MARELAREILSRNMRKLCAERGIDTAALARDLEWPSPKLEAAMSGSSDIDLADLTRLASVLAVPAHLLLTAPSHADGNRLVDMAAD